MKVQIIIDTEVEEKDIKEKSPIFKLLRSL